jgi:hypothetical protein
LFRRNIAKWAINFIENEWMRWTKVHIYYL